MQIFSTSHTFFSSRTRERAFTLVELMVCIALIGIVTAIILVRYGSFDSSVLLKDAAYEIAATLREAQVKSVSVVRDGNSVNYPYGVSFSPGQKNYYTFQFRHISATPLFANKTYAVPLATTTLIRSMQIDELCITLTAGGEECDLEWLDISFRRPEFKALFYARDTANNDYASDVGERITEARIIVGSTNGGDRFVVRVSWLGQVTVEKE